MEWLEDAWRLAGVHAGRILRRLNARISGSHEASSSRTLDHKLGLRLASALFDHEKNREMWS